MSDSDALAKAVLRLAEVHDQQLGKIATEIGNVALQLKWLGNGNAGSPMGAIEFLASELRSSADDLTRVLGQLAPKD